jgi:hypothetical protein
MGYINTAEQKLRQQKTVNCHEYADWEKCRNSVCETPSKEASLLSVYAKVQEALLYLEDLRQEQLLTAGTLYGYQAPLIQDACSDKPPVPSLADLVRDITLRASIAASIQRNINAELGQDCFYIS